MAQCQIKLPNALEIRNAEYKARVRARNISIRWLLAVDPLGRTFCRRFAVTVDVGNREIKSRIRRIAWAWAARRGEGEDFGQLEGLEGVDFLDEDVKFLGGFGDFLAGGADDEGVLGGVGFFQRDVEVACFVAGCEFECYVWVFAGGVGCWDAGVRAGGLYLGVGVVEGKIDTRWTEVEVGDRYRLEVGGVRSTRRRRCGEDERKDGKQKRNRLEHLDDFAGGNGN